MKGILLALALFLITAHAHTQIKVPYDDRSVMVDGRFEIKEWENAARLKVNDSTSLYLKQDKENLYLCVHMSTPAPSVTVVDFYLLHNNTMLNLHASAQLGERQWKNNSYGDWIWWNNHGWQATVARIGNNKGRRFLDDEAKEFQLRKSRFQSKEMSLMFDIGFPNTHIMKFPADADTSSTTKWLKLAL